LTLINACVVPLVDCNLTVEDEVGDRETLLAAVSFRVLPLLRLGNTNGKHDKKDIDKSPPWSQTGGKFFASSSDDFISDSEKSKKSVWSVCLGLRYRKVAAILAKAKPEAQEGFKNRELMQWLEQARQGQRVVFSVDSVN
jgi:hypothetical protein